MANPYYSRVFNATVSTIGLPVPLRDEFDRIVTAFDNILISPAFSGAPTVVTQTYGDNTTKIATTAFVQAAVAPAVAPLAPIASPAFTGTPIAPTAATGTNTTQIATTAFVVSQSLAGVLPGQTGAAGKFVQSDGTTATWQPIHPIVTVSSSVTLTPGAVHQITGGPWNLTLPASPTVGMLVGFANRSGIYTHAILRNGSNIESVAADEVLDVPQAFFLEYANATDGWIIV